MSDSAAATQLSSHPINEIIRRVIEASESPVYAQSREVLDESRKAVLDRLFVFSRRIQELVASATDADVSFNGLNVLNNSLTNALSEVNAFYSNRNPGHIDNVAAHLDSATSTATWTFYQVAVKGSRAYAESIGSVKKAAESAIAELRTHYAAALEGLTKTQAQIDSQQQAISTATEQIASNKQVIDSALTEFRATFQNMETEFRKRVDDAEKERSKHFNAVAKGFETDAATALKKLSEHEAAAKRIVQIVGNVGVTGNYQNRATEERKQANLWRFVTVGLFATGVILVTATLIMHLADRVNLTTLITRFAIAVAITIPAIYTARESARHRTNADRAKQTELELASLGPFLETLPPEQRREIIAELAKSYFGREVEAHEVQAPISAEEVRKTIAATADLVGKVKGAT